MLFPRLLYGEELSQQVRCPIHGFIKYSPRERQIIDHPVFQRLRNIRQLALCCFVYPGAMHSRLEHSLGVMELTTKAFEVVAAKQEVAVAQELQTVPEFKTETLKRARQSVRLAGLLHDIGHGAFSHAAESVMPDDDKYKKLLPSGQRHERITLYVIDHVLRADLDSLFFEGITDVIIRILTRAPDVLFLRQFVSGELDMDRTDYLLRDSYHCGVEYGRFDYQRLLESLSAIKHPDTDRLQVAIERGGEHTFEALILARYQMNTQVYYHRLRRIYDHYLTEYMKLWGTENYRTPDDVLRHHDLSVLVQIEQDAKSSEPGKRFELAKRIQFRKHHKSVYESGDNADAIKLRKAGRILKQLQTDFPQVDFYLDDARASIHKVSYPGQQDGSKVEDFFIVNKNGSGVLITEDSEILEKIPKEFRSVRIYAECHEDLRLLEDIRDSASKIN